MKRVVAVLLLSLGGCSQACDPEPVVDGGPLPDVSEDAGDSVHDPLSRPEEPTLFVPNFNPAGDCASCHQTHFDQWRTSNHAYAMVDPVYRAIVKVRQQEFQGEQDQFCLQCHSAIGTRGGEIVDNFDFERLSEVVQEGVTCEACHKVESVARPYNSGHVIDEFGPARGPIADPMDNAYHRSSYDPLFEESEFCAGCHDVVELNGLNLERPYAEWLQSPAPDKSCQSCHMPEYEGRAAIGAPLRTLHDHGFIGVEVPLAEGFVTEDEKVVLRERVHRLLDTAASLHLDAPALLTPGEQLDLFVTVRNEIDAHNLPTGSTFIRQVWLEVTASDADGNLLYATGDLDANGDLRNAFSEIDPYGDSDLVSFSSSLTDARGNPEVFPWRAVEHTSGSLSPLYERTHTLFVPTRATTRGPITVQARLRFRSHGPFLLRALGLDSYIDDLEIYDLASGDLSVGLIGPDVDAGPALDAGQLVPDAGARSDAGARADAGALLDAGVAGDAGGSTSDAGASVDAG